MANIIGAIPISKLLFTAVLTVLTACVVVPVKDLTHKNKCEISSDRKTLKVMDMAKDNNTYYSISGIILLPITGVVSGVYVAVNNVYHLGNEILVCD